MQQNLILASIPEKERKRLQPFFHEEELAEGTLLIEENRPIRNVYFPHTLVGSTLQELKDGSTVEAGLMGVEGFIGLQLWLRQRQTPSRTIVQVRGRTARMAADDFVRLVMEVPESPLNPLIARYIHGFLVMTAQVAACNRLHEVEPRLCRWLKMIHNRVTTEEFPLRQEFMAAMLGVSRPTVSITAKILQKAGLIDYSRGKMRILDGEGLRAGACECYDIMENQFARIFKDDWVARSGASD